VSNSLALLLAHHGTTPPWDARYGAKFASVCLGIDAYEKTLFRTGDGSMVRLTYDNIEVAPGGEFRLIRKPSPPEFRSFAEHVGYLREQLRLAFTDAVRPDRSATYRPLATCSSGYDSAGVTALAAPLGCREAVTLRRSRSGQDDSGKSVGELLGYRAFEFDRPETVDGPFEGVADFFATGMGGEDYCYRAFAPLLPGRVLLTGAYGDRVWGLHAKPGRVLERGDVAGAGLQEFRLWTNFIHIPVPMIGARRHPEIAAISNTSEMREYRLHNDYDRPIPRRLLEDAGVPRAIFGQRKKATSLLVFLDDRLLDPETRRECEAAVPREWVRAARRSPSRASWEVRYWVWRQLQRARRIPGSWRLQRALVGDWRIFEHSHPRSSLELLAGLLVVARRYQKALQATSRS
jgi:hypothetical protein